MRRRRVSSRGSLYAPDLDRLLQAFPAFFHEPYYASYQATDLPALFSGAGLTLEARDHAFLTKALLFRKPEVSETTPV